MRDDALPPIELARATWRDVRALVQLDRRCFKPIDAYAWYEFLNLCLWPGLIALKVVQAGRIVGFIAGDPRRRELPAVVQRARDLFLADDTDDSTHASQSLR